MTPTSAPDLPEEIKNVMIGGNHLASALLGTADPAKYRNLGYYDVLEKHGQPYADMFVAWKAIMELRDANTRPKSEASTEALAALERIPFTAISPKDRNTIRAALATPVPAERALEAFDWLFVNYLNKRGDETTEACIRAIGYCNIVRAALTQPPTGEPAKDGWKLVPIEPTVEMEIAGCALGNFVGVDDVYKAMIEAAPPHTEERG